MISNANKIIIIGTSGSGKTTLGRRIASCYGRPHTDLDDLHWFPGWTKRTDEEFTTEIQKVVDQPQWILTGNYSRHASVLIWPQADAIIWLDLPLSLCLWQGAKRSLRHLFTKKEMCNGNLEQWSRLLGRESILLWIWNTHKRRTKQYSEMLSPYQNKLIRIRSQKEIDKTLILS